MPDGAAVDLHAAVAALAARVADLEHEVAVLRGGSSDDLRAALVDLFGTGGRFTASGLLELIDGDPHSDLGLALARVVNLSASHRSISTAIGMRLSRAPWCAKVSEQRGAAVFEVRT